jgi:uncharacterized protein (TIGR04255 family)
MRTLEAMKSLFDPFSEAPPVEVPLPHAPLVRVVAQVRFPPVLSIESRDFVAPFQEAVRERYPILRVERTRGVFLGPGEPTATSPSVIWRFNGLDEKWRVSLATDFAAIETTAYESRSDLLSRFGAVLQALQTHIAPGVVDRLGVRYIDRIKGDAVAKIGELVRPEVLGVAGTAAASHASHALSEVLFDLPDQLSQMRARWGLLPSGSTVDPSAIEPIDEQSWILDLDTFTSRPCSFDTSAILSETRTLAERSYGFFRWVVTDEFLRHFGGRP